MADREPARLLFQSAQGKPVGFYLHPSIKKAFQRENLTENIVKNGGKVLNEAHGVDTVLVDETHLPCSIEILRIPYTTSRDEALRRIAVEPMKYVQSCIRSQKILHKLKEPQGMGGYIGRMRTKFTDEDKDNLCWYISRRIPNAEHGGRLSSGIWKELMAAADLDTTDGLKWARRHTVQSWREHYKKNRASLDPVIDKYVAEDPPEPPAKYGLSRQYNKKLRKSLKFLERHDDVIDITDDSAWESEEIDVDVRPRRRSRSPEKAKKPSKRRRIESPNNTSSPGRLRLDSSSKTKGKQKQVDQAPPETDQHHQFDFSPAPEPFEPGPSHPRQLTYSAVAVRQGDTHLTPAPSPTLVQRPSSAARSPRRPTPTIPSPRRINLATPSHPSTSFRNVVHSSPAFAGQGSPGRSGVLSHSTSVTEPSSRSLVVPPDLARPATGVSNAPAESSITRESSHKPSSPISQPIMRKASRKLPSRQPPIILSSDDDEEEGQPQESQWAPYKNTRSRSRSIEPVSLQVKKKRREGKGRQMPTVHESEVEQNQELEQDDNRVTVTETMQDEQDVADFLRVNLDDAVSGTLSGVSTGQFEENGEPGSGTKEETEDEDEGEGVRRAARREKEEEEEETQEARDNEADESISEEETVKYETAPMGFAQSNEVEPEFEEDDLKDISSFSESDDGTSPPKDKDNSTLDISSDDEFTRRKILSQARSKRQRRASLSSEDGQISQMTGSPSTTQSTPAKTAQEVLELYGSSPEVGRSQQPQKQRKPFDNFRTGSPSPLQPQPQNRSRQSLPVITRSMQARKPAQARASLSPTARILAKAIPVHQKLTGPHRVSFGDNDDAGLSSPSSVGLLPRTPVINAHPARGGSDSQPRSSLRRSVPLSQPGSQSRSRHQGRRRDSAESTSSELVTWPIGGTRASTVKQEMEQVLKNSPYTPPSGTKAASARRRLRPPKRIER